MPTMNVTLHISDRSLAERIAQTVRRSGHSVPERPAGWGITSVPSHNTPQEPGIASVIIADAALASSTVLDVAGSTHNRLKLIVIGPAGDTAWMNQAIAAGAWWCLAEDDHLLSALTGVLRRVSANEEHHQHASPTLNHRALVLERNALLERVAKLSSLAGTDPLTGLHNRRWADAAFGALFAQAVRHDEPLSCAMFDLDHFKPVNDELGHARGDELLKATAEVLTKGTRGGDVVARLGGDEFAVFMPKTTHDAAASVCKRIAQSFAEHTSVQHAQRDMLELAASTQQLEHLSHFSLSIAFGVACTVNNGFAQPHANQQALLEHADHALGESKRTQPGRSSSRTHVRTISLQPAAKSEAPREATGGISDATSAA